MENYTEKKSKVLASSKSRLQKIMDLNNEENRAEIGNKNNENDSNQIENENNHVATNDSSQTDLPVYTTPQKIAIELKNINTNSNCSDDFIDQMFAVDPNKNIIPRVEFSDFNYFNPFNQPVQSTNINHHEAYWQRNAEPVELEEIFSQNDIFKQLFGANMNDMGIDRYVNPDLFSQLLKGSSSDSDFNQNQSLDDMMKNIMDMFNNRNFNKTEPSTTVKPYCKNEKINGLIHFILRILEKLVKNRNIFVFAIFFYVNLYTSIYEQHYFSNNNTFSLEMFFILVTLGFTFLDYLFSIHLKTGIIAGFIFKFVRNKFKIPTILLRALFKAFDDAVQFVFCNILVYHLAPTIIYHMKQ